MARVITQPLASMTVDQLWQSLERSILNTARVLMETAQIWCVLKGRGEDMSRYSNPMFEFFPDVVEGKLLPEVLLKFGASNMSRIAARLPASEQAELAKPDATVPLRMPDGSVDYVAPAGLTIQQTKQVFADDGIRDPDEQEDHMAPTKPYKPREPRRPSIPASEMDKFDLSAAMTRHEINRITDMAKERDISPAHLAVLFLRSKGFFALRAGERRSLFGGANLSAGA